MTDPSGSSSLIEGLGGFRVEGLKLRVEDSGLEGFRVRVCAQAAGGTLNPK